MVTFKIDFVNRLFLPDFIDLEASPWNFSMFIFSYLELNFYLVS